MDASCIVAFEESVNYDVEMAGGLNQYSSEARECSWPLFADLGRFNYERHLSAG